MTRTIGSAIGVLIIVLFMAHLATRLSISASPRTSSAIGAGR